MSYVAKKPNIIKETWKCHGCGGFHDYEYEAMECCQPEVSKIFICPICEDDHPNENSAIDCCGFDPDAPP